MAISGSPGAVAVRILADDLSGALDAAGPFAERCGPFTVYWDTARAAVDTGERVALDAVTREADTRTAIARTSVAVRSIWTGWRGLAFKKIDSVWRGSPAAEIATAAVDGGFERIVVAPAFPQQGRVTREGAQWTFGDGRWRCVAPDIAAELRGFGLDAAIETRASPSNRTIVCDASSPDELDAIVARHARRGARTLWCGTSGLARALADCAAAAARPDVDALCAAITSPGPVLVVVGTDHPVSIAQASELAQQPGVICRGIDIATGEASVAGTDLAHARAVLLRFAIPVGTSREVARQLIAQALRDESGRLPQPRLVLGTGGETVRALSEALGATHLEVLAEREPGVPIAAWTDGCWAGTPILSKSGGFGSQNLFTRVIASIANRPHLTRNSR